MDRIFSVYRNKTLLVRFFDYSTARTYALSKSHTNKGKYHLFLNSDKILTYEWGDITFELKGILKFLDDNFLK